MVKRIAIIDKFFCVILILVLCCSCSIKLDYFNPVFDYHRAKKIASRNYIDKTTHPYFSTLTGTAEQVYYDIYDAAVAVDKGIIELTFPTTVNTFKLAFFSFLYDNPEIFWVKTWGHYEINEEQKMVTFSLVFYDDVDRMDIMKEEIESVVSEIVNGANQYSSLFDKERYVHDVLVNKITYDSEMDSEQRVYSALVQNRAVCAGYAKSFQLIMKRLGIPTYLITGTGPTGVVHGWNAVEIEGNVYFVDVTNDDGYYGIIYDYYNLSDAEINATHTKDAFSTRLINIIMSNK